MQLYPHLSYAYEGRRRQGSSCLALTRWLQRETPGGLWALDSPDRLVELENAVLAEPGRA